jgi:hypothetical protein
LRHSLRSMIFYPPRVKAVKAVEINVMECVQ